MTPAQKSDNNPAQKPGIKKVMQTGLKAPGAEPLITRYHGISAVLITLIGIGIFSTACAFRAGQTTSQYQDAFLIYSRGGGMDMYEHGDRFGHKLELYDDDSYALYRRIYQDRENGSSIEDELIMQGEVDPARMDTLRALIADSDFFALPHRLPDVSPLEVEHREPAETVTITIRKEDGSMHRVQSYMGVDLQHYPESFLDIHRFLRDWNQELLRE